MFLILFADLSAYSTLDDLIVAYLERIRVLSAMGSCGTSSSSLSLDVR